MLNDKRIKSCLSRFDSGAYSRLQFLRAVSHTVGTHTESLHPRVDNSSSSNSSQRTKARASRRPCQQQQLQRRRNRQRQLRQQPRTIVAVCIVTPRASFALVPCGHTGWPKKVSHYQFFKKIVLKIANEIRILSIVKV